MNRLNSLNILIYFAMLGFGFMFVEVTLIQKSILLLENPAYAITVVLTAILISSGIGSFFSSRFYKDMIPYFTLILSGLIAVYNLIFTSFINYLSYYPSGFRIFMFSLSLIPLGFFMGIPFPAGIRLLGQKNERLIPWAWAVNGCISVLTPILTIILAMTFGFKIVLWAGSLAYLIAFVAMIKINKTLAISSIM